MRTFKSKLVTRYYIQNLLPVASYGVGTLYRDKSDRYFLRKNNDELVSVATHVGRTLRYNKLEISAIIGPYVCWNGFEHDPAAKKLIASAKTLYPTRELLHEVAAIMDENRMFVTMLPESVTFRDAIKQDAVQKWSYVNQNRIDRSNS